VNRYDSPSWKVGDGDVPPSMNVASRFASITAQSPASSTTTSANDPLGPVLARHRVVADGGTISSTDAVDRLERVPSRLLARAALSAQDALLEGWSPSDRERLVPLLLPLAVRADP
jgi:hypothetical protein